MAVLFTEIDTLNEGVTYDSYVLTEYTIPEVRAALKAGPVLLRFTKKTNGARRNMYCTLKMDLIPRAQWPQGTGSPSKDPNHIRVYDLVKKAWRSFIMGNIHSGKFKQGDIGYLDKMGMKTGFARDKLFDPNKTQPSQTTPQPAPQPSPKQSQTNPSSGSPSDVPVVPPKPTASPEKVQATPTPPEKPKKKAWGSFVNWLRGKKDEEK